MYRWIKVTRVLALPAYCSEAAELRLTVTVFSHIVGPVYPYVLLKFGARALKTFSPAICGFARPQRVIRP